jgi:hypothetical protein
MLHRARFAAGLAMAASLAFVVGCDEDDEPTAPNVQRANYSATLTGAAERPTPVTTNASGTAQLTLFDDDSVTYLIRVANIDSVTSAHIHAGDASVAGNIIVGFPATNPPANFTTLTTLHQGTITRSSTFTGVFTFDSLMTRLNNGTAYVNVHTRRNPGGEIRGQITRQ